MWGGLLPAPCGDGTLLKAVVPRPAPHLPVPTLTQSSTQRQAGLQSSPALWDSGATCSCPSLARSPSTTAAELGPSLWLQPGIPFPVCQVPDPQVCWGTQVAVLPQGAWHMGWPRPHW